MPLTDKLPKIEFFKKLFASLDNHSLGYSGRKLTALFAVLMGAYITIYKLSADMYLHALYAWQALALLCLGIVTVQNIIDFKNGGNKSTTNVQ
jgi:hypothetical protein